MLGSAAADHDPVTTLLRETMDLGAAEPPAAPAADAAGGANAGARKEKKKKEARPPPEGGYKKKPTLTKAERRAAQEAQRAAKGVSSTGDNEKGKGKKGGAPAAAAEAPAAAAEAPAARAAGVLAHLRVRAAEAPAAPADVHPAIAALGARLCAGEHAGANARCRALLEALKGVIEDYRPREDKTMARDLDARLVPMLSYVERCRPIGAGAGNATKTLRRAIAALPPDVDVEAAKGELRAGLDAYVEERIELPLRVIGEVAAKKINDGDVVLTFGEADALVSVFAAAKARGVAFRVVVVDAAPDHRGRRTLGFLHSIGVDATYCLLHAASLELKRCTTAIVGCDALFSNGAVLGRAGTAAVAALAAANNVPTLVCCESYKFHDRVQLDAVASNEVVAAGGAKDAYASLGLVFDVAPARAVSAIVTEHGLLPPSACAVLIRELGEQDAN